MTTTTTAVFQPPAHVRDLAYVRGLNEYRAMYQRSVEDPEGFWTEHADRLEWVRRWDTTLRWDFEKPRIEWFAGGQLNASVNCLDRHVAAGHGDTTAIIWEGNDPSESRRITYRELLADVERAANALKALGVRKGDRVCIYLQM
ncbi:MAG: acetyl-coenzyme A synthetase N-terminal domain-containing protein, partial [bacterium]|nr:acetyl-coenzyme A synthetase N-terminal domain-containing protein [bacterium]